MLTEKQRADWRRYWQSLGPCELSEAPLLEAIAAHLAEVEQQLTDCCDEARRLLQRGSAAQDDLATRQSELVTVRGLLAFCRERLAEQTAQVGAMAATLGELRRYHDRDCHKTFDQDLPCTCGAQQQNAIIAPLLATDAAQQALARCRVMLRVCHRADDYMRLNQLPGAGQALMVAIAEWQVLAAEGKEGGSG